MARKLMKEEGLTPQQAQEALGYEKYKERYQKKLEKRTYKRP